MGQLIIAGQEIVDLGPKFRNWTETGWNATIEGRISQFGQFIGPGGATGADAKNTGSRRYASRPALRKFGAFPNLPKLEAVQAVIKKFVLHHDGVSSSAICWDVLHNERGLSCHFLIDNDGTIFQTLDLALMGFHAAKYNVDSIGVEFCNRGIMDDPNYYVGKPFPHPVSDEYAINGHKMRSFDFTQLQYESFFALAQALVKALPNLALEYPRDPMLPTKQAWGCLGPVDAAGDSFPANAFAGFLGHYHLTTRKWDPGPFDFKKWIDKLRGQRVFPVAVANAALDSSSGRPVIPDDVGKLADAVAPFYDANELAAEGGFFPVGPWGQTRLWHGGIHLPAEAGAPVFSPFPGRVIAGRTKQSTAIGSNNFVLLRHDLNVASQQIRVYSLFMHLDQPAGKEEPGWMGSPAAPLDAEVNVDKYDHVVDAGALIGYVGVVGPDELQKPQLHFEIFSTTRLFQSKPDDPEPSPWGFSDGSGSGRFCEDDAINALIDSDKDGRLSHSELVDFYENGDKAPLRNLITLHASEWAPEPDWGESLRQSLRDFQKKTPKTKGKAARADDDDADIPVDAMVEDQIKPFLWWTDAVAKELKLPNSGIVYHYHPMRFIEYVSGSFKSNEVKTDVVMKSDIDDTAGDSAFAEFKDKVADDLHLKLENLVDGYDGDVPPP